MPTPQHARRWARLAVLAAGMAPAQTPPPGTAGVREVDQGIADRTQTATSARVMREDIRGPLNFERLWKIDAGVQIAPGVRTTRPMYARMSAGTIALFPQSSYTTLASGLSRVDVPPGTMYVFGDSSRLIGLGGAGQPSGSLHQAPGAADTRVRGLVTPAPASLTPQRIAPPASLVARLTTPPQPAGLSPPPDASAPPGIDQSATPSGGSAPGLVERLRSAGQVDAPAPNPASVPGAPSPRAGGPLLEGPSLWASESHRQDRLARLLARAHTASPPTDPHGVSPAPGATPPALTPTPQNLTPAPAAPR